jgi:glyoxylase I family protein
MISISRIHHVAIICTDYKKSKHFYTEILGFTILAENYRSERDSYKLDLEVNGSYAIELFSFPNPAPRPSRPEAAGLRHLAFQVEDIYAAITWLNQNQVATEPVRIDEFTAKRFTFFSDPDGLPLEFYEIQPV